MENKPEERSPKRQRAESPEEQVAPETSEYTEEEIQKGKALIEAVIVGDLASSRR